MSVNKCNTANIKKVFHFSITFTLHTERAISLVIVRYLPYFKINIFGMFRRYKGPRKRIIKLISHLGEVPKRVTYSNYILRN